MSIFFDDDHLERIVLRITRTILTEIYQMKETLMALVPEVQALVDAIAAQGVQITAATTELTSLEGTAAILTTQIAALQAQIASGAAVDPDDLAAIVAQTSIVTASIASIQAAMPQPVPPATVAAAAPVADPAAAGTA
ncbi:MAG TPA: hypothetical protein VK604_12320 [Bryobacteraceae bacterium]|nr:hypothetical protein [Bryobacteraceae bacterium]